MLKPTVSILLTAVALLASAFVSGHSLTGLEGIGRDLAGALDDARIIGNESDFEFRSLHVSNRSHPSRGWNHKLEIPAPPQARIIAKSMTLCVPLLSEDTETFQTHFVKHLNAQTVMPSELVVAMSAISGENARKFESLLRKSVKDIPVLLTSVDHHATAGENRNRCAMRSRGEVITFFDADDLMHHRRIEILDYVFQRYHPKVVVSQFISDNSALDDFGVADVFECVSAEAPNHSPNVKYVFNSGPSEIAQGWATVSRDVFERVRYNETSHEGEDVQFLNDVMEAYGDEPGENALVLVRLALGSYIPRRDRKAARRHYIKIHKLFDGVRRSLVKSGDQATSSLAVAQNRMNEAVKKARKLQRRAEDGMRPHAGQPHPAQGLSSSVAGIAARRAGLEDPRKLSAEAGQLFGWDRTARRGIAARVMERFLLRGAKP